MGVIASFKVLQVTLLLYLGGPETVFVCCEYQTRTNSYMVQYTRLGLHQTMCQTQLYSCIVADQVILSLDIIHIPLHALLEF